MESMKLRCRSEVEFIAHFLSPSPNLFQIAEKKDPYDSLLWCLKTLHFLISVPDYKNVHDSEHFPERKYFNKMVAFPLLWLHFFECILTFFFVTQHTKVKMMVIGWNCIGGTALCASNKTHLCSTIITGEAAHTTRKILQVRYQEIKYQNSNLSKCEMNEPHFIL